MTETTKRPKHVYPIDHFLHANEARLTAGLSQSSASAAYLDWAVHLANSPGKQGELIEKAFRKSLKFTRSLHKFDPPHGHAADFRASR